MVASISWGKHERIVLEVPADWKIVLDHRVNKAAALEDFPEEVKRSLKAPTAGPALSELLAGAKKAAIVIDDVGRPTPGHLIAPVVLDELIAAGVKQEQVEVIFATGTHRPMTEPEMRMKAGEVFGRVKCANHDCRNVSELAQFGTTSFGTPVSFNRVVAEADLRVLIGTIEPHPQAGFGGGLKMLLPGTASAEAIGHNHLILPSPEKYNMIGTIPSENPMRRDIEEAAGKLPGKNFIVNTVLGPDLKPVALVSGDAILAHRKGVELARKLYGYRLPRKVDAIITSSFPMDQDLRQGVKGVANAPGAVRKGGVIICFLKCERGVEDMKPPNFSPPLAPVRLLLKLLGARGIYGLSKRLPKTVPVETRFIINFGLQVLKDFHVLIFSPQLVKETRGEFGQFLFDDQGELFARARQLVGDAAESCVISEGGVSFPLLEK